VAQTRVMVADDNEYFGTLLGQFVASQPDMDVVGLARTGREAVSMAAVLRPDVVLMDLFMPDLDGFEATRLVSLSDPRVAVIALTAQRAPDLEKRSLAAGARAFVHKPDAAGRLIDVIRGIAQGADSWAGRDSGSEETPTQAS
jgi:DNA-binding NarL/FixJ family response regulator